jgi:hypothetical protein
MGIQSLKTILKSHLRHLTICIFRYYNTTPILVQLALKQTHTRGTTRDTVFLISRMGNHEYQF